MNRTIAVEPRVQFRSKSIIAYNMYHPISGDGEKGMSEEVLNFRMSNKFRKNAERLKEREKYTGQITKGAKKRLTKAISLLIQSSPRRYQYNPITGKEQYHQLSFITLTLPDVDKSKDAAFCHKYLLQPILRIIRNKYKMKSYVWKCELQENGSVHYHITTELFIVWTDLRNHWNSIVRSHGMYEEFRDKYGHDNPNSVDIHSVEKVNDMEAYLVKYISKEYQNEQRLAGKVWDCSKNLKASKYFSTELDLELHQKILEDIHMGWALPVYADKCVILKYSTTDYYINYSQSLINKYYSHLTQISQWESKGKQTATRISTESATVSSTLSPRGGLAATKTGLPVTKTFNQTSLAFKMYCYGNTYLKS